MIRDYYNIPAIAFLVSPPKKEGLGVSPLGYADGRIKEKGKGEIIYDPRKAMRKGAITRGKR